MPGRRIAVLAVPLSIPLLGLVLLLARPGLDVHLRHDPAHFWLVLATAAVSLTLAEALARAVRRRRDARLLLVSLVFQVNAGFLGLHALATPGVALSGPNLGFDVATPIGLLAGGVAAAASSLDLGVARARAVLRNQWLVTTLPWIVLGVCALLLVARVPPLATGYPSPATDGAVTALCVLGSPLYVVAGLRYLDIYRRRPSAVLLSVVAAFALLAETMIVVGFGRSWHASWWEWHVLMVAAFALIAVSVHGQFRREGSALGLFDSMTLGQTIEALEQDYTAALEELTDALRRRADGGVPPETPLGFDGLRLARRFSLTEAQLAVLQRSATALGAERDQVRRLSALVRVAERARVLRGEPRLLADVMTLAREAFPRDLVRLWLLHDGRLLAADAGSAGAGPAHDGPANGVPWRGVPAHPQAEQALRTLGPVVTDARATILLPLVVKQHPAGVLEVRRPHGVLDPSDQALLASLAGLVSVAVENARLYDQLDGLFRSYMSPAVATALIADPDQAGLGGRLGEVSVLMADLCGFTPYAERHSPQEVVTMLNTYYGAVVPVVIAHGGTVVQFVGDAVMALFNAPARQPDHAARAAGAALALHRAVEEVARGHDDWPRFRVGVNTGPALVGNIGAAQMRNYTAIGDTTNLAARLQALAEPGRVVVSAATLSRLGTVTARPLGTVQVSGRTDPVRCLVLEGMG